MPSLTVESLALLRGVLERDFLPHLPPLIDTKPSVDQQLAKNLSRAFSAFAIHSICGTPPSTAASAVIDDFDDYGVDAIFYHAPSEVLYLIQSKLKASSTFTQDEALAFCQGIRKLINQDLSGFNKNVQERQIEIEDALENCSRIVVVVAHTGAGISNHAKVAVEELLSDDSHGDERFAPAIIDYDATRVLVDLQRTKAYERVDANLYIYKCASIAEPRTTYFGLIPLSDLVDLHRVHGKALYERNIRTFLGHKTDVNASIQKTLATSPNEFFYLNNGVAGLCQEIESKGKIKAKGGRRKLNVRGLSVINGAQTIASAVKYLDDNPAADIDAARVAVTLIRAPADGSFGKSVTRARNHQNPVLSAHFVALDDEQERLRREVALLGIHYAYKPEVAESKSDPNRIAVDEAATALALFHGDPRFVVWLKKNPARLLETDADEYKSLFSASLTAFQLVNAVQVLRYVDARINAVARASNGAERLTYRHGRYAVGWVLAKGLRSEQRAPRVLDVFKMAAGLSSPMDLLRQAVWAETQSLTPTKGPLAIFRNQTDVLPILERVMIGHYNLAADPVLAHKRAQHKVMDPYPRELFEYLSSKAPQLGGLS